MEVVLWVRGLIVRSQSGCLPSRRLLLKYEVGRARASSRDEGSSFLGELVVLHSQNLFLQLSLILLQVGDHQLELPRDLVPRTSPPLLATVSSVIPLIGTASCGSS